MKYIFIYNDSFISLMSLIDYLIDKNIRPENIKDSKYSSNLFDSVLKLEINNNEKILIEIIKRTSIQIFKIIYYVFLSEEDNKELIIYYFYLNALKYRNRILNMRNLKCVNLSLKISQYVSRENHKYKGFVRFKELANKCLYAEIEPVNNILGILSNHFKMRLKAEYWVIKDNRRNILSIYDKKDFYIVDADDFMLYTDNLSENEKEIKDLWVNFYNTIGIESRKNERCRMNFMPKRYWKYIIEMEGVYEKGN